MPGPAPSGEQRAESATDTPAEGKKHHPHAEELLTALTEAAGLAELPLTKAGAARLLTRVLDVVPPGDAPVPPSTLWSWLTKPRMFKCVRDAMAKVLGLTDAEFNDRYKYRLKPGQPAKYVKRPLADDSISATCGEIKRLYNGVATTYQKVHEHTSRMIYRLDGRHVWVSSSLSESFSHAADRTLHESRKHDRYASIEKGAFLLYLLPSEKLAAEVDKAFAGGLNAVANLKRNLDWIAMMREEYVAGGRHGGRGAAADHFDAHVKFWHFDLLPFTPVKHTVSVVVERADKSGRLHRQVVVRHPVQHISHLRAIPEHESNVLYNCIVAFLQTAAGSHADAFTRQLLNRIQGYADVPAVDTPAGPHGPTRQSPSAWVGDPDAGDYIGAD